MEQVWKISSKLLVQLLNEFENYLLVPQSFQNQDECKYLFKSVFYLLVFIACSNLPVLYTIKNILKFTFYDARACNKCSGSESRRGPGTELERKAREFVDAPTDRP